MSSRHTNPRIPNKGGSGKVRGNAREDGPVNTLADTFHKAAPFWHHRLAGKALNIATGLPEGISISMVHAIDCLLERGVPALHIRCALNDLLRQTHPDTTEPAGADDGMDWLREELDLL